MRKAAIITTAIALAALMAFTGGCGKQAETLSELTSRGESIILTFGGYGVSGDMGFIFDDGSEIVNLNKTLQTGEDAYTGSTLTFNVEKDTDEGFLAVSGTFFLGKEESFWDVDEGDLESDDDIEVVAVSPRELAEARLAAFSENPSFTETEKGEVSLWNGSASSFENGSGFYEMCAGGDVGGQTFYMSLSGVSENYQDSEAAVGALSAIAEKIWESLKIQKIESTAESLLGENSVAYRTAGEKILSGAEYNIAGLDEINYYATSSAESGDIEFDGFREVNGKDLYLSGFLGLYSVKESFESAQDTLLSDDLTESMLSGADKKTGKNIEWSVRESTDEKNPMIYATAEKDGLFIICRLTVGCSDSETQRAAYERCMNWLLSLEAR